MFSGKHLEVLTKTFRCFSQKVPSLTLPRADIPSQSKGTETFIPVPFDWHSPFCAPYTSCQMRAASQREKALTPAPK